MKPLFNEVVAGIVSALVAGWITGIGDPKPHVPVIQIRCGCAEDLAPQPSPKPTETPVQPSIQQTDVTIPNVGPIHSFVCNDDQGKAGSFRAVVFLDTYNWSYKSVDLVEFNHQPIDFLEVLKQPAVQQVMSQAREIVAVGTASCEASKYFWGQLAEERRAGQRARQLAGWITSLRPQHVHELNVGRFQKECKSRSPAETWNQRRIVLISVTERAEDLDLESCLKQSMKSDPLLEFLIDNYSRFKLDEDWKS